MDSSRYIASTKSWLKNIVIGLSLCPFAREPHENNRIRFVVSRCLSEEELIDELVKECEYLDKHSEVETTLLICSQLFENFFDFNDFLYWAEQALDQHHWRGIYQLASFHPEYQFADTHKEDQSNYTNRSPFPTLHILREDSLSEAIEGFPNPEKIPEDNIAKLQLMSPEKIKRYFSYLLTRQF
ncbi:MAG: DUF1415 domain-containing protein [Pseudomonadota bacterium]